MEVGQKIFLEPYGNAARYSKDIIECTISKIGRKYFQVEELRHSRFHINSMSHDGGDYMSQYKCYESMRDIEDKNEAKEIHERLTKKFFSYSNTLSLRQLKEIELIVNRE